jgi:hypothetical protein
MKYLLAFIILILCSGIVRPVELPVSVMDPSSIPNNKRSAIDTLHITDSGIINVKDFGAKGNGIADDYLPIQKACDYCILNPTICNTVRLPVGNYRTTHSIMLQYSPHGSNQFFTIKLTGDFPNKSASNNYLSRITYDNNQGFAIGVQLGRSIEIANITVLGKYTYPYSINNRNIGTRKFSDWNDGSVIDSRYSPYAGIVIDPFTNPNGSSGGTSGVEIRQCAIKQFMVGVCLTPNNSTQNDEMINILDDNIEAVRVAVAIGQDQSKEIHIDRLKCWASTHTILDGVHYGRGTGGGSVMIEGMNIAGNVNELFNVVLDRFPLSAKDIYSESLFRIGSLANGAGANFINFQIDFLTGHGMPAADYLLCGSANFSGGSLRYYDNSQTHRLNLSNMNAMFRDLTLNNPPFIIGLYGGSIYPTARFDNVHVYYSGKTLESPFEAITKIPVRSVTVDRSKWVATVFGPGIGKMASAGDYILGSPDNKSGRYYDAAINPNVCPTIQIGRITSIVADTLYLDDVGLNAHGDVGYDGFYVDKTK